MTGPCPILPLSFYIILLTNKEKHFLLGQEKYRSKEFFEAVIVRVDGDQASTKRKYWTIFIRWTQIAFQMNAVVLLFGSMSKHSRQWLAKMLAISTLFDGHVSISCFHVCPAAPQKYSYASFNC